ncbi:unnamed protein product [Pedinophyceae sp. YPF-701]|nr:unnamed protein product [Pedinophyceae sp. YPF-701]
MEGMMQQMMEGAVLQAAQAMEEQLDQQIAKLDNMGEDDIEAVRRRRIAEMKKMEEKKALWRQRGHGSYGEVAVEKDFFSEVKGEDRAVVHFYRPNNFACAALDRHLDALAKQHIETKFFKVNAEKSPYLSEKLSIQILPSIALVKKEKVTGWIVGLDEFGGTYDFPTKVLAARLAQDGLIDWKDDDYDSRPVEHRNRNIRKGGGDNGIAPASDDEDSDFE